MNSNSQGLPLNNQLTCNRKLFCVIKFVTVVPISLTRNQRQLLSLVLPSQAETVFSYYHHFYQYQYCKELVARQESIIAFDWSKQGPVRLFCKHTIAPKCSILQFW